MGMNSSHIAFKITLSVLIWCGGYHFEGT